MPRDLAISNGRLLVMFDRQYRIRDLYFPHVGKENHGAGHAFRFGVWVGGEDLAPGLKLQEWAAQRTLPSGTMAEQLHPYTGEPLSVSPLTWSHAEYVRAVQEYIERHSCLNLCPSCGHAMRPTERRSDRQIVMSEA